jgi:hypothetical protein
MHVSFGVGSYLSTCYKHRFDAFYLGAPVRELPFLSRGNDATFAFVGRLAADTGISDFIRDLDAAVMRCGMTATVRLAGEGPIEETLRSQPYPHLLLDFRGIVTDPEPVYAGAGYIVATGFLAIFDAFRTGIPVIIPAYSALKQDYARSIPGIDDMAFILTSPESAVATLQVLMSSVAREQAGERAGKAAEWIRGRTWDEIADLLDIWYRPSASSSGKTALQHGRPGVCA